jgi:hypothetical protein
MKVEKISQRKFEGGDVRDLLEFLMRACEETSGEAGKVQLETLDFMALDGGTSRIEFTINKAGRAVLLVVAEKSQGGM